MSKLNLKSRLLFVTRLALAAVVVFLAVVVLFASQMSIWLSSDAEASTTASKEAPPQSSIADDPYNDRLAIQVTIDGLFNIGAFPDPSTGGAKSDSWDLMYKWPKSPWLSFSTFRIDGTDNIYGSTGTQIQAPADIDASTNQSEWQIGDIWVTQTLQLVLNNQTGQNDVAKITYSVRNTGTTAHDVGGRVMIDTELNYNDGAPFRVPGDGIITTEKEYVGSAVPDTFLAFFDVTDSTHVAAATLKSGGATTPDRLVFASWPAIFETVYDYAITPNASLTSDSAYALYWNPTSLAPGESRTYVTYYGLAQLTADLRPALALGITAPATLSVVHDAYSPNPFTVTATVLDNGAAPAENVAVTLHLSPELSLVSGAETQHLGTLLVGQERQVTWEVRAATQSSEKTVEYSVDASADGTELKTVTGHITLPPLLTNHPPTLSFVKKDGYANDANGPGVEPNIGIADQTGLMFRVLYTDEDNDPPVEMMLVLEKLDAGGAFIPYRKHDLLIEDTQDSNYVDGKEYFAGILLPPGTFRYHFEAKASFDGPAVVFPSEGNWPFIETVAPSQPALTSRLSCFLPSDSAKHMVFITHGWGADAEPGGWVEKMGLSITNHILKNIPNPTDWTICTFDWREEADRWDFLQFNIPKEAFDNAAILGTELGIKLLARPFENIESIHFIAHSAGSNVIQKAAEVIRNNASKQPRIHLTFFDAFEPVTVKAGYGWDPLQAKTGILRTDWWAEQYVDRRALELFETNSLLPDLFNFDVSELDKHQNWELGEDLLHYLGRVHGWPYVWYATTTPMPFVSPYGFPLSLEGGRDAFPLQYRPNGSCKLFTNNDPCPTNTQTSTRSRLFYNSASAIALNQLESTTGTITYPDPQTAILHIGSPVWFKVPMVVTTTEEMAMLRFDYRFLSEQGSEGILSVFRDEEMVYKIDERIIGAGPDSGDIRLGALAPGEHFITFRLDPFTDVQSVVEISNVRFGTLVTEEVIDEIAPITTATTSGTLWKDGSYLGTTTVAFTTQDNEGGVGVEKTEYSFDGGQVWKLYTTTSPVIINAEGTTTVTYRSVDYFGNAEVNKNLVVKIVSVKWLLEDALAKLKSITTGNRDIDKSTDAVEKDLSKVIADKSWLDRNRLSWPKGLSVLTKEADAVKVIGDILNKAGQKRNNIPAATQTMYHDAQSEIVQSSALLAKLSFDKAKAIHAKNASGQKALDRAIARIQKMLDRASAKESRRPKHATQLYGAAWFASEALLKAAGATQWRASDFGTLYTPEDMKDLVD